MIDEIVEDSLPCILAKDPLEILLTHSRCDSLENFKCRMIPEFYTPPVHDSFRDEQLGEMTQRFKP
jgi:hypothetical protein